MECFLVLTSYYVRNTKIGRNIVVDWMLWMSNVAQKQT